MSDAKQHDSEDGGVLDLSQLSDLVLNILSFFDDSAKALAAKRVCKAARERFKDSKRINICDPNMPLWAVQELFSCPNHRYYSAHLVRARAIAGDVEGMRWLMSQPRCDSDERCTKAAAEAGHLEVLKALREGARPCRWDTATSRAAAKTGNIEMLQWLRSNDCPFDEWVCFEAAAAGRLEVLAWLRAQQPPVPWNHTCCEAAAETGNLELLQWLRSQEPPCPWGTRTLACAAAASQTAAIHWLRDQECPWDTDLLAEACAGGNVDIVQQLVESEGSAFRTEGRKDACLNAAAEGHIDVLRYLRGLQPEPCPWDEQCCFMAAVNGHLDCLMWMRREGCPWDKGQCLIAAKRHPEVFEWVQAAAE